MLDAEQAVQAGKLGSSAVTRSLAWSSLVVSRADRATRGEDKRDKRERPRCLMKRERREMSGWHCLGGRDETSRSSDTRARRKHQQLTGHARAGESTPENIRGILVSTQHHHTHEIFDQGEGVSQT